jgi:hypothetical protein
MCNNPEVLTYDWIKTGSRSRLLNGRNRPKMEHLYKKEQTAEPWLCILAVVSGLCNKKPGLNMWQRTCPVCQKLMEKKHPAETVPCPCGKFIWKG